MNAPINFQAVQTIYALERKRDFFYLEISSSFLKSFNFNFSIQSLLDIQSILIQSSKDWNDDELRCLAFYIVEMFARITTYHIVWEGDFADYHAIFSDNDQAVLNIPVFENLEQTIVDLVFNLATNLKIDLLQYKDTTQPLPFKPAKNTQHLQKLAQILPQQEKQLYTAIPAWCTSQQANTLYNYFGQIPTLLKKGFKIKARIVQANHLLFDANETANCPAEIVFDLQNRLTYEDLRAITEYLYSLRSRTPETLTIKERRYADHLNNEVERSFSHQLSDDLLGYPVYISSIFVDRTYLPTRALTLNNLEILLNPDITRYVMVYPCILWESETIKHWENIAQAQDTEREKPLTQEPPSNVVTKLKIAFSKHPFWCLLCIAFMIKLIVIFMR